MKTKFNIGDKVITKIDCIPYYSGYAGNPNVMIPKGTIGTIGSVKTPYVNKQGYFNCVDFVIPSQWNCSPRYHYNSWRASLTDKELKLA